VVNPAIHMHVVSQPEGYGMNAHRCVCTVAGEGGDCRQGTALGATPWIVASSLSARRLRARLRLLRRCVRQPWLCFELPEQGGWGSGDGCRMRAKRVEVEASAVA
jgi:hypothetical protein